MRLGPRWGLKMQVLFVMWLLMVGMKSALWDGLLETSAPAPAKTVDVVAAEGPVAPPPPNP
jgi:hypothetical protein